MVRICPRCQRSFAGGRHCERCGPDSLLVEACDPRARALMSEQAWKGLRALYGARRAMLLAIGGALLGAGAGLLVLRRSVGSAHPADVWVWRALALGVALAPFALALARGVAIARRSRRGYDLPERE